MKVYALLHKSFYEMVSLMGMILAVRSKLREIRAAMAFIDDLLQAFDRADDMVSLLVSRASFDGILL